MPSNFNVRGADPSRVRGIAGHVIRGPISVRTWVFTTPTLGRVVDLFHSHPTSVKFPETLQEGLTAVRESGVWSTAQYPGQARLDAADSYLLGGHVHPVTDETKNELEAAGISGTYTETT